MSQPPFGFARRSGRDLPSRKGFSLVELLVVLAIVAILASLLLPAIAKAKTQARSIQCLSNTKQLTLGWLMYADDHDGWLCPNGAGKFGWVGGTLNFDSNSPDNTNINHLIEAPSSKLGYYVRSPSLYRCPLDKSMVRYEGKLQSRARTLAMNDAVGSNADGYHLPASFGYKVYRKVHDITSPSPANLWLLIEQHPDSINDGRFAVDCFNTKASARWIDFPANFHDRASILSFTDGHSEIHKWVESVSTPPNLYCGCLSHYAANGYYVNCPKSADLAWLQERTSAKRN